jgi:hypothetical protein
VRVEVGDDEDVSRPSATRTLEKTMTFSSSEAWKDVAQPAQRRVRRGTR